MSDVAFIGLVLLGLAAYLAFCVLCIVYVSTAASLVLASAGSVVAAATTLGYTVLVLSGRLDPAICTPEDAIANRIGGFAPAVPGPRDDAWPNYFVRQVWYDLAHAATVAGNLSAWLWQVAWRWTPREGPPGVAAALAWPLLLPVVAGLVGFTAGAAVTMLAVALLFLVVTSVAWSAGLAAAACIRLWDRLWQRRYRAAASCDHCYYVTSLPAYRCPGDHRTDTVWWLHHDLRPGRQGVLWRRCSCGQRLPTGILRAAARLEPWCPMCRRSLPAGAAVVTDARIAIFGTVDAGKTQLVLAALFVLAQDAERHAVPVTAVDEQSGERLKQAQALVDAGLTPERTDPTAHPSVTTLRLTTLRLTTTLRLRWQTRAPLVHFFDASGEALADAARNERYGYFDYARALVYVVDPLRLPGVCDVLGLQRPDDTGLPRGAVDPEDSYHATVNRLRLFGVDTRRQRLAIVVTKADIAAEMPADRRPSADPASVRCFLTQHGLDNVVLAAERDFGRVRYFLCSATAERPQDALPPFRWLLAAERIHVGGGAVVA
jgi:hypothetical protein